MPGRLESTLKFWKSAVFQKYFFHPITPWLCVFLFSNFAVYQDGGINAMARIAGLRAITEGNSLNINQYVDWTNDWSRAPSGKYYSNKAPGGVILGLPIFALTELIVQPKYKNELDSFGRRPRPGPVQLTTLCFFTQMLPLMLLVFFIGSYLWKENYPAQSLAFFALAAMLGNTAALYMNSYFGHGLAAVLFLSTIWQWWNRQYFWTGLLLGLCVLSDYGAITTVPAFILFTVLREKSWKPVALAFGGIVAPALLFSVYHYEAFGSPIALASAFINPNQLEVPAERTIYWGTFSFLPTPVALHGLLISWERGLLATQPWVFLLFVLGAPFGLFISWKKDRNLFYLYGLLFLSFSGLLWMNAGVGGWHGGLTIGPRYLSSVFPAAAFLAALLMKILPTWGKIFLWTGLLIALVFRLITFPFSALGPHKNLWLFYWDILANAPWNSPPLCQVALLFGSLLLASFWFWINLRRVRHKS